MALVKVIEVIAESDKGWEDAAQNAVKQAAKTVRNIQNIYIKDLKAVVKKEKIVQYRAIAKISFMVD